MNSFHDKLFVLGLMLAFMIPQAIYQARRFKRNKPISHALHGIYRGGWCVAVGAFFWDWRALVLAGVASLNYAELLGLIRGSKFGHVGNSWTDRAEVALTDERVWVVRVAYIIGLIAGLIWL
jgi:hypothetical protein